MRKKSNSLSRALDRVTRAFASKDEKGFDEAMDNLEEKLEEEHEEESHDESEPEIEVHNHIPDARGMMDGIGELPGKEGGEKQFDSADGEMPPWFKEHKEATDRQFKRMNDALDALRGDRRHRDNEEELEEEEHQEDGGLENLGEYAEHDETAAEENLEMEDRHRDRRHRDGEEEEMEDRRRNTDRGNRDRRDEANKEILGELEFEAPPGTGDRARKARDSRYLEEAFQDALSKAEQLVPSITLPTFDRAAPPLRTLGQINKLRRTALDLAYAQPATRHIIDGAMSGRTFDSKRMKFAPVRVLFNAAATAAGMANNQRGSFRATDSLPVGGRRGVTPGGSLQTTADINKRNKEFFGANKKAS